MNALEPKPHDPAATADDILACFRLILGRAPGVEELTGHLAAVGSNLSDVVSNYVNSMEFEQRHLLTRKPSTDIELVQLDDYRIYTPVADEAVGRHVAAGAYDHHIATVIRRFLKPGMGALDLGANIGVFALLAATLVGPAGYVLAVEPNAENVRLLEASRRENNFEQLTICQAAATEKLEVLALHSFGSNGTATAADRHSILTTQTIAGLPIGRMIGDDQIIDLIKIDVEGGEYKALMGLTTVLSKHRPVIVSEFSPGQIGMVSKVTAAEYLRFLQGFGYKFGVIARDGSFEMGLSIDAVHKAHIDSGVDHIDIIAMV